MRVHPYYYPQIQKEETEKLVEDVLMADNQLAHFPF